MNDIDNETGDWEKLLDEAFDKIEEPKLTPTGPWVVQVVGSAYREATENQPPQYSIGVTLVSPTDEVDPDKLGEVGDSWKGTRLWLRARLETPQDRFALVKLLRTVFGVEGAGKSYGDVLKDKKLLRGKRALGIVGINSYKAKQGPHAGELIVNSQIDTFVKID